MITVIKWKINCKVMSQDPMAKGLFCGTNYIYYMILNHRKQKRAAMGAIINSLAIINTFTTNHSNLGIARIDIPN